MSTDRQPPRDERHWEILSHAKDIADTPDRWLLALVGCFDAASRPARSAFRHAMVTTRRFTGLADPSGDHGRDGIPADIPLQRLPSPDLLLRALEQLIAEHRDAVRANAEGSLAAARSLREDERLWRILRLLQIHRDRGGSVSPSDQAQPRDAGGQEPTSQDTGDMVLVSANSSGYGSGPRPDRSHGGDDVGTDSPEQG